MFLAAWSVVCSCRAAFRFCWQLVGSALLCLILSAKLLGFASSWLFALLRYVFCIILGLLMVALFICCYFVDSYLKMLYESPGGNLVDGLPPA